MTQRDTETTRGMEIVCRLNVMPDGNGLVEVMLSPWGKVTSKAGDFMVDEESARLIQENFRKEGRDLPWDFNCRCYVVALTEGQARGTGQELRTLGYVRRALGIRPNPAFDRSGEPDLTGIDAELRAALEEMLKR